MKTPPRRVTGVVDSIFMTRNEVELHRAEKGKTALILVSAIVLTTVDGAPTASGGTLTALLSWNIDDREAAPMAFQLRRRVT